MLFAAFFVQLWASVMQYYGIDIGLLEWMSEIRNSLLLEQH